MSDERLQELEAKLEAVLKKNQYLESQTEWLEDELGETQRELQTLRQRVAALEDTTDLLDDVQAGGARKPTERAAVLIQTLHKRAQSADGSASLDVTGALDVLRLDPDKRTLMYETFDRAAELVGESDAVHYRKESRSSSKNSRLVLDLDRGELPETAAGHELKAKSD